MLGQKNWLVIMVAKNTLQLIRPGEEKVETIIIPPSIINNMEVINKDSLYTLITDWLKLQPHVSAEIIWLLAPEICFEHTLTSNEQDKIDSETLQFLDSVPFEDVLSRVYKPLEWRQVIAVNKDLIMSLIQGFSLHGYVTKVVVPSRLVPADSGLTIEIERIAIKKAAEFFKESLISLVPPENSFVPPEPAQPLISESKSPSFLPLLLGVFGALLAILIFVLVLNK